MRGEVLTYDDNSGTGLISGDDGVRYQFRRSDLQQLRPVAARMKVDFVPNNGFATEVFLLDASGGRMPSQGAPAAPSYAVGAEYLESSNEDLSLWGYFTKCMSKSFNGEGRARRKEYWSFVLFEFLIMMALYAGFFATMGASLSASYGYNYSYGYSSDSAAGLAVLMSSGWFIAILIVGLIFLPASITVLIRRLHDLGLTGWWILAALIPFLGGLFLFVCTLIPSERRVNKHGLYPKPISPY